jgi:hypothetical protein
MRPFDFVEFLHVIFQFIAEESQTFLERILKFRLERKKIRSTTQVFFVIFFGFLGLQVLA